MNQKKTAKSYLLVILAGMLLNLVLYEAAHFFKLPMWMDTVGTAYAAVVMEPAAGLLAAFATSFFQAAVIYDSSSLIYYTVSALGALTFGILLRKNGRISWKKLPVAMLIYIGTATLMSGLLTLWRNGGVSDSGWERKFAGYAMDWWNSPVLACFFGVFVLKVLDTCVIAVLLPILHKITPKFMKNAELHEPVSWKNKYWNVKKEP